MATKGDDSGATEGERSVESTNSEGDLMRYLYRRLKHQLGTGRALANARAALTEFDQSELDLFLSEYAARACSTGSSRSS